MIKKANENASRLSLTGTVPVMRTLIEHVARGERCGSSKALDLYTLVSGRAKWGAVDNRDTFAGSSEPRSRHVPVAALLPAAYLRSRLSS